MATRCAGSPWTGRWPGWRREAADRSSTCRFARSTTGCFRWTTTPPPAQPDEHRVAALAPDDDNAIESLLDRAFSTTAARPGAPLVRRWYGIRGETGLVACGADRSRNATGELAAIAVEPAWRRRGLGGSLVAAMTRRLLAEYGVVGLGVMAGKPSVARLYQRLGFIHTAARTSAELVT